MRSLIIMSFMILAGSAYAQSADEILQKADEIRAPSESYRMEVAVESSDSSHFRYEIKVGGKDSSLALYHALRDEQYSIQRLLTNINNQYGRVSMHGVQEALMEQQAEAIGLPLQKLVLPDQPSMSEYEAYMMQTVQGLQKNNLHTPSLVISFWKT